jgi:N-acetylglucosaminyldiphosphoundecaprenol N-acetyl-beta-D-mannosaminyltransferase
VADSGPSRRVDVLGCPVDRLTLDEAAGRLGEALASGRFTSQFSANAAKVVAMRDDPRLAAIAKGADLVTADGSSIVLASRLFGDPLPERVTGIDLMHRLFAAAEEGGHPVFILGATRETLDLALARLRELHPGLTVAGARDGYFDLADDAAIHDEIRASGAALLIVAMGSPRSELWIAENARDLGVAVPLGVGGSLDVLAGRVKRAPAGFQRLHLEWLYRLAQEPRRLIRRNLASVTFWRMALAARLLGRG